MYLLAAAGGAVAGLRERLEALGDSLVIAGGGELWSVHVHVADAGAAIEAGLAAGRLQRIRVTYLDAAPPAGHQVLAICGTAALAGLARAAGARVLRSEPDAESGAAQISAAQSGAAQISAAAISAAVRPLGPRCIIVPDGPSAAEAARAATPGLRSEGIEVAVVEVRSAVQAVPALAVHEPAAGFAADAAAMSRAASRMRWASVAMAAPGAGPSVPGQAGPGQAGPGQAVAQMSAAQMSAAQMSAAQMSAAQMSAALGMIDELVAGGAELVTFLAGDGVPAGLAELVTARVRAVSPAAGIDWHAGAAAGTLLLAGAE
jgi:dihydroxyacetone kinase-like predicted kinase